MLNEICAYLKNWFKCGMYYGTYTILGGVMTEPPEDIQEGQYFRILGSVFNDGIHKHPAENLTDETFEGALWLMAVPPDLITLADKIKAWQDKYGAVDSSNMSPYNSESFGGYSYSKSGGGSAAVGNGGGGTWQGAFASRLARWRKI